MSTLEAIPWSSDLCTLAARFGERIAVTDGQASLSYRALCARAHALAARLAALGVAPGEPVATSLPNSLEAVWASYGVTVYGAAEMALNHTFTDAEVEWLGSLARFRYVVTRAARCEAFDKLGYVPIAVESIEAADDGVAREPIEAGRWGRITPSSGTTGKPKALVYTHGRRWLAHTLLKQALPYTPGAGSRVLLMTPFPHGASLMTYAWLDYGGEVILLDGVDPARVSPILERGNVAAVFAPPTVLNKLADVLGDRRFAGVRCVFTGTQTLTPATYERARAMFGPVVRVTYGKGECTNPITVLAPADTEQCYANERTTAGACVGWPASGVEIEVRDEAGTRLPAGDSGEVHLRARHMYVGQIDANGFQPVGEHGWHQTGDIGFLDARGRLWLCGRAADVMKTGGYKVNPDEIEAALNGIDACGQIVVTSVPSAYWGEVIVAATEQVTGDWQAACGARLSQLSRHKHPRAYVVLEFLPRNPQGKISRRTVRERILARYTLEDGPRPRLVPIGATRDSP